MGVAARNFIAHLGLDHRRFKKGEEVPEEWAENIGSSQLIVDGEDAIDGGVLAGFVPGGAWQKVMDWVLRPGDPVDVQARARHALDHEEGPDGKNRVRLVDQCREILGEG